MALADRGFPHSGATCTIWYMMLESSVTIAAPAADVFTSYLDVERWPQWSETVTTVKRLDPGPLEVGSRTTIKQPRLREAIWEVTELQQGRSFTWVSRAPGVISTARHVVAPMSGGAVVTLSVEQAGPLGGLVGLLTKRLTARYLALEGAGLKRLCEG